MLSLRYSLFRYTVQLKSYLIYLMEKCHVRQLIFYVELIVIDHEPVEINMNVYVRIDTSKNTLLIE